MNLKNQAVKGMSWSILIQLTHQFYSLFLSIILTRILSPEDFGTIGIIAIFINFSNQIIDGGLATSLIRNKESNQTDFSTIFFSNLFISISLYLILFFSSGFIADFFDNIKLEKILKIYGLVLIISSFSTVQSVRLTKNLDFKTQYKLTLPSLILSAIISIWMAYNGFGLWSLVFKEIVYTSLASIQIWIYSKWKPSFEFNWQRFKYHFEFGYKIMLTNIIKKSFYDSFKVLIGKKYTISQLGFFTRAQTIQELPTSVIFNAFNRVAFPLLAKIGDDDEKLKNVYRKLIISISYIITPILIILGILAYPIFILLFTEKWVLAVPFFQILIIGAIVEPLKTYNQNICKIKGRSDLILKFTILECILISIVFLISLKFGMNFILWGIVGINLSLVAITSFYSGRLINYSIREQFKDIYIIYFISILTGIVVYIINYYIKFYITNLFIQVVINCFLAIIFYIGLSFLMKIKAYYDLKNLIINKITK